jgi:hypothetical protein
MDKVKYHYRILKWKITNRANINGTKVH